VTAQILDRDNPDAPFGYDEDGTVIAPYGLKANGQPRLSNRGRSAGQGFGTPKKTTAPAPPKRAKRTAAETPAVSRNGAVSYQQVATGLVQLSTVAISAIGADPGGFVSRLIGKRQTLAIKGDATILTMFAEPLGNAIGGLATINPWLANKLEGGNVSKEVVVFATTVAQLGASLVANHRAPSEELAAAGEQLAALQAQEVRRNVQAMTEQGPAGPTDEQLADELAMREHLQQMAEQQQAPAFVSDFAVPQPGQIPGQTDVYEQLAHAS